MAIYLVFLYLLHAQSFTKFQGLSRNDKNMFSDIPENLADTKREFYKKVSRNKQFFGAFENYCIPDNPPYS